MININLIAERRSLQLRRLRLLRVGVYGVGVMALGTMVLWVGMGVAISTVEGKVSQCEAKLTAPELARSLKRIKFLEDQEKSLSPRVQLLQKVRNSRRAWIRIMRDVSACIPPDVWLTGIVSQRNPDGQSLKINGTTTSQLSLIHI